MENNRICYACCSYKYYYNFKNNYKCKNICIDCARELSNFKRTIHNTISTSIRYNIDSYIWKYLPYSMNQLKSHLQAQFKPWMNWNNRGIYVKNKWNDIDPSTCNWQIDHIIPQSKFIFYSVNDKEFLKCWELKNLQPLSSKENRFKGSK